MTILRLLMMMNFFNLSIIIFSELSTLSFVGASRLNCCAGLLPAAAVIVRETPLKFNCLSRNITPTLSIRDIALAGSASNKIFRRSAVGDIRFPEGLWYEDFDFSAKLICAADKTAYVDEALYIYRRGHESTMNNNNAVKNLDILAVMGDLESLFHWPRPGRFRVSCDKPCPARLDKQAVRAEQQRKKQVIKKLRAYVRDIIPDLSECDSFRREPRNRRIVMRLNYTGLDAVSRLLLRAKKAIK